VPQTDQGMDFTAAGAARETQEAAS
jgi:hypothetical protein